MTTQEFITRNFGIESTKDRKCSSVYADKHGNIFSYGSHYPLMFRVGNLTFVNNLGYSNTTAKHINWAKAAVGYNAIDVWLQGCNQYSWNNPENRERVPALLALARYADSMDDYRLQILNAVWTDLEAELANINDRIASKTRKNTKIYQALLDERDDCTARIKLVAPHAGGTA